MHEDSFSLHNKSGDSKKLKNLLDDIARQYTHVKTEKETQYQYFLQTIKNIDVGLLAFNEKGIVELHNNMFEKLFNISEIRTIDELGSVKDSLPALVKELKPQKHHLLRLERNNELVQISVTASEFFIGGRKVKLVSFRDIRNELQQEQIETQQKLVRVLTHEIMNSIGPITSLSSTIIEEIEEDKEKVYPVNIKAGLNAIYKRSQGLGRFVKAYRSISTLPKPALEEHLLINLVEQLNSLFAKVFHEENVDFEVDIKNKALILLVDEKMIMQVFINIIQNAVEALPGQKQKAIRLTAYEDFNSSVIINIENNGNPIPNDMLDKIFLPFFTTKEGGSGIGLSLSRQIMHLHGGTINLKPLKNKDTLFELVF